MSFTDIKTKNQGFTIVELLIVVVVIAILAAITIVSYNGITNRANASAAKSTAATWQKKIELYHADKGAYPYQMEQISNASDSGESWYMVSSSPLTTSAPTTDNGKNTVRVQACGASAAPTTDALTQGIIITYYDYEDSSTDAINLGTVSGTCADF